MDNIDVYYLFCVLVITFGSMVLHELAHGVVAFWLGDDTAKQDGRLSLNPLRHIDPVMTIMLPLVLAFLKAPVFGGAKPVPVNTRRLKWGEWGFALVAIAGPLTNFILALIFFLIAHFSGALRVDGWANTLLVTGVSVNLGFMLFNILPIPPLDGSRVLYAVAPEGVQAAMRQIERYGIALVFAMVFLFNGFLGNYMMNAMQGVINLFCWLVGIA